MVFKTVYSQLYCSAPAFSKLMLPVLAFFFFFLMSFYTEFSSLLCGFGNPIPWSLHLVCLVVCCVPVASPEFSAVFSGSLPLPVPGSCATSSPRFPKTFPAARLTPQPQVYHRGSQDGASCSFGLVGMFSLRHSYP